MRDRLKIAHCSDIHLDGDAHGSGADTRAGFALALAHIAAQSPDLMLLAGDLFDTNAARLETIQWAMEALAGLAFPVVMIPGNHDCMMEGAIYRRHDFNRIPNVRLLAAETGEIAYLPGLGVAAWGKGMVDHSTRYSPLGGCPARPGDCRWYGADTDRSSPIHMREIEASACDYLALGHHHAAMELVTDRASAAYSGSPTDLIGRGATYVLVELAAGQAPSVAVQTITPAR